MVRSLWNGIWSAVFKYTGLSLVPAGVNKLNVARINMKLSKAMKTLQETMNGSFKMFMNKDGSFATDDVIVGMSEFCGGGLGSGDGEALRNSLLTMGGAGLDSDSD